MYIVTSGPLVRRAGCARGTERDSSRVRAKYAPARTAITIAVEANPGAIPLRRTATSGFGVSRFTEPRVQPLAIAPLKPSCSEVKDCWAPAQARARRPPA